MLLDSLIAEMSEIEQIQVINAHPRIGAPAATLSPLSFREQGLHKQQNQSSESTGSALAASVASASSAADLTMESVLKELARLNAAYEQRLGFKFVVFVNGRSRAALLPILRQRMERARELELATGLDEMMAIARDRLGKLLPQSQTAAPSEVGHLGARGHQAKL